MPRKMATATLSMGMVTIPFGIAKASTEDVPDLKTLCSCGGPLGPMADDDGNKVACKECGEAYSWYNAAPGKGFKLGDEMIQLSADEVEAAKANCPVETGQVEKAVEIGAMLLTYAVDGNYYLLPESEFEAQYGALVGTLNEQDLALLTYFALRSKVQRFGIVSRGGVLIALRLRDKKALPDLEYGVDEAMEAQAAMMLDSMRDDDPTLEDVEGYGLKQLVREKVTPGETPDEAAMKKEV